MNINLLNKIVGKKYTTYISTGFMLMKKTNSTCGELAYRYFTMRWYTEGKSYDVHNAK